MILVKSLIVLFLILIGFYIYNHLNFLQYFDGREGFAQQMQAEQMQKEEDDDKVATNEVIFTPPSSAATLATSQQQMSTDATNLNVLQNKITELFQLKNEALAINNNLNKK
jgi:hypothetical protein